jgi:hypothetical protein
MKNAKEPTYSFVILTAILVVIDTILAWLAVKIAPTDANGISWLFFAVAFMIIFTLWFGAYGAIAAYAGTLIGSGLLATPALESNLPVAMIWAVAGLLQVVIPLLAVRRFKVNLSLENPRDWTYLILFGVVINNFIGAAWSTGTLALSGLIKADQTGNVFFAWVLGNIIVTIIIVPIVLRHCTAKVQKSKLFVRAYWD